MPPIPVLVVERNPDLYEWFGEVFAPRFEVVHVCKYTSDAIAELPHLLSGDLTQPPASGRGTNAKRPVESRRVPRAVVMGWHAADAADATDEQALQVLEVTQRGPQKATFVFFPAARRVPDSMLYVLQLRDLLKKMVEWGEIAEDVDMATALAPTAPPPPGTVNPPRSAGRRGGGWGTRISRALRWNKERAL